MGPCGAGDAVWPALAGLHGKFQLLIQAASAQDSLAALIERISALADPAAVVYYGRDAQGRLVPGAEAWPPGLKLDRAARRGLDETAAAAVQNACLEVRHAGNQQELVVVAASVWGAESRPDALCLVATSAQSLQQLVAVAQLGAAYLSVWHSHQRSRLAEWEAHNAAALVELITRLEAYDRIEAAAYQLAGALEEHLCCRRVAVGRVDRSGKRLRVVAVSGAAEVDRRTEQVRELENAMHECLAADRLIRWPADAQRTPARAHKLVAQREGAQSVVSGLLRDGQTVVGAWVFVGDEQFGNDPARVGFIEAAAPHVGACLGLLKRHQPSRLGRIARHLWAKRKSPLASLAAVACLLVAVVLALPFPYRIRCHAQLAPVQRRFVAAPFDGLLEKTFVLPGDVVRADQLLARMEDRQLRWELAGLMAERNRVAAKKRVAVARQDAAGIRQADLEAQRLDNDIRLLQYRIDHLEIRSPIDGVVLTGDLEKAEGAPLKTGQTLFEIGPLGQMVVEIAVPEEDVQYVYPGMEVTMRLDALPGRVVQGRVRRVHPRAEVVDGQNVFIAEMVIGNEGQLLRPGMSGRAKLAGPRRPLAWILFHKPWNYLLQICRG
ncbi:MAG TPA: HlyD family efflux transporter periplasmic adaptor subunit [Planctomycetaceae bacterium]|nr:HlyD family efflux transporter periplasmic adaptor subunit [Planctomycetaceae bacterium]HIQ20393.1 HlyD family efflux transporter periplasmic adaptor subunit [Planctomycetota bacterium]